MNLKKLMMSNELTDKQKDILALALFKLIAYTDDGGRDEIYAIAQKMGIFAKMAKYAHSVLTEMEKRMLEQNTQTDSDAKTPKT